MTRKEAIEILEKHHMWTGEPQELIEVRKENEALNMAIASLKTDEAYQLEYENRDFVEIHKGMTNGEVIQALFPYVKTEDTSFNTLIGTNLDKSYVPLSREWWNSPYQKGGEQ